MTQTSSFDFKVILRDTFMVGLVSLILFGPIVGIVLDGYGFNLEPQRVGIMVAVVMAGRFLLSLFGQTSRGRTWIESFKRNDGGVHVLPPGHKSNLRYILPIVILVALIFPFLATKYWLTVVILCMIYVLLGLGLNIVVGLAGLLDLGYVGFYAIGAYGLALGYQYLGLGFWTMIPLLQSWLRWPGQFLAFRCSGCTATTSPS